MARYKGDLLAHFNIEQLGKLQETMEREMKKGADFADLIGIALIEGFEVGYSVACEEIKSRLS